MKKIALTGFLSLVVATGVASAQDAPAEPAADPAADPAAAPADPAPMASGGGGAKYGAAGCGLGSIVFGAKPGFMQVFAATTNGTSASQTFGITSGTSNCSSSAPGGMAARQFIETNRQAFAKDVSRGSGETIASLATLSGCQNTRGVGVTLQKSFTTIFPNAGVSDTDVSSAAVASLKADKTLACTAL
jgi:hypothetical protein